ncbi:MAG: hypothetical protein IKZ19_01005, partial [Clostridia bacterium]|nr:hypothetical protein [Clostridia bacterium]
AFSSFDEISKIAEFIGHPNLTVRIMFFDVDDYRVKDKKRARGGSVRYDRVPTSLNSEILISGPEDLIQLLPADLPEEFTSADLAKLGKVKRKTAKTALTLLTRLDITVRNGKRGRFYLYHLNPCEKQ